MDRCWEANFKGSIALNLPSQFFSQLLGLEVFKLCRGIFDSFLGEMQHLTPERKPREQSDNSTSVPLLSQVVLLGLLTGGVTTEDQG